MKKIIFSFTAYLFISAGLWAQSITPEIIADIRNVTETSISPSGTEVAYILRVPGNDASGMQKSTLLTIPKAGGSPKTILEKMNPGSIQWSKDGKKILFLATDTVKKNRQIFAVEIASKTVSQVTSGDKSITQYAYSPDGLLLGMIMTDGKSDFEKEEEKKKRDWIIYDDNQKYARLYTADASDPAKPKMVHNKSLHTFEFVFSPDSKTIYFRAAEKTSVDYEMMYQRIFKVDALGGDPDLVCETNGKLGNIAVSPDGKNLAYCGAVDISDPLAQSVFVVSLGGGEPRNLTDKMEASAVEVQWVNANTLIMLAAEGCYSSLKKIDVKTGKHTGVYSKGAIIRSMNLHAKSGAMAFSASTPQHPNELFIGTTAGGLKKITDSNPELRNYKLTKQEVISWTGPDGWKIEGVLTYPKDYKQGTKYPLLLQLHGGPEGVSANGWNTRGVYPAQLLAANGFFVLEPNYRGSQGRGVAFTKGDHKDLGGKEFDDILAGIDMLVAKGMVDKDKVGTGGFSYGGYLSAWAGTKHSDRFKAAVMGAGISNWISFSGTTEIIHENSLVHWDCWWPDQMELVWDRSPLSKINNAKTPMLIIHGGADTRVPLSQSEEMYNALKLKKVHTQLVVYKRQPHGILEREAQIDYMNRIVEWFKDNVK